jgi:DNA sulfur modification protein DndD
MKICRVTIQNFKILQDVDITFDGGLTFLNANNGCGKTTFQEAVKWCLYGNLSSSDSEPLASKIASEESAEIEIVVRIMLENPEKDDRIEITRQVLWNVAGNRPSEREVGGKLRVRIDGLKKARAAEVLENPSRWVEDNFPSSLLSYFLFDGEIMYKFFEEDVKARMGAAIKSIARVEAVDELERLFASAAKKFRSAAAKEAGPDVIGINQAREQAAEELQRLRKIELPEADNAVQYWESMKTKASKTLSRLDDAKDLIRSIEEFDKEGGKLEQAASKITVLNNEFVEDFLTRPHLSFKSAFAEIPKLVDKAKREGWYPLPFSVAALEELIEEGMCICGNHLKPGSEAEQKVLEIIADRREMGEKGVELGDLASGVQTIVGQISEATAGIHRKNTEIMDAQILLDQLQEAYQLKLNTLGNLSLPDAKDAQAQFEQSVGRLSAAKQKLEELSGRIAFQKQKVEEAEEKLRAAQGRSDEEVRLNALAQHAEKLAQASQTLANEAVEDVKRRIRVAMDEAFAFIGDGAFITKISDDFALDTVDRKGRPAGLSEGQKMVRAYIFSVVLRQVVGYQFPLLVDTPLGRLDTRNSREAANLLSDFVASDSKNRGMQIIMSMHDAEYTPYVKQHFARVEPQELYIYDEIPAKLSVVGEGIHASWWSSPGAWKDWKDGKVAQ